MSNAQDRAEKLLAEYDGLRATYGDDVTAWPDGQRTHGDRLQTALQRAYDDVETETAAAVEREAAKAVRIAMIREAAKDPKNRENGFGGASGKNVTYKGRKAWSDLNGDVMRNESANGWKSRAEDALGDSDGIADIAKHGLIEMVREEGSQAAAFAVAASNPAYQSAFLKYVANPERAHWTFNESERDAIGALESVRAVMTSNVGTGGYLIPLALQPGISALTNVGVFNPFREIATVKQTISSPARMAISVGVNAEWKVEGAAASDASPTITKVDVPLFAASAYVAATYELVQDTDVSADLVALFGDARDRLESAAFATGNGTTAPAGVVTRVAATAGSVVTATTRGSFTTNSSQDVYAILNALTPRSRKSPKAAWLGNNSIFSIIRGMSPSAAGSSFWANLDADRPEQLLGINVYESSSMSAATTSGSNFLICGDFASYTIFDHVAGASLQYNPIVIDQATGRPNGTGGWYYFGRVGADVANADSFRVGLA